MYNYRVFNNLFWIFIIQMEYRLQSMVERTVSVIYPFYSLLPVSNTVQYKTVLYSNIKYKTVSLFLKQYSTVQFYNQIQSYFKYKTASLFQIQYRTEPFWQQNSTYYRTALNSVQYSKEEKLRYMQQQVLCDVFFLQIM